MADEELGPWAPLTVEQVASVFGPARFRWWLAGGCALEAHFGWSWRSHDDIDIGVIRTDAHRLLEVLDGWDIHLASDGVLSPWDGRSLETPSGTMANNLWCRRSPDAPWSIDVLVGEGDDQDWIYRRDETVRRPWVDAVLTRPDGLPYLAPEIQLLFKSKGLRAKDNKDAAEAIPKFDPAQRTWLAQHLAADHPWQTHIAGKRAHLAAELDDESEPVVSLLSGGRSSQAWLAKTDIGAQVIRVPIPNSGRLISYRSEVHIGQALADAGHPVSRWELRLADDVECSIGEQLPGYPIDYTASWSRQFTEAFAAVLHDLHRLPFTGWGPLANRSDVLQGVSESANRGVVDRWFHATMWPFDGSDLASHAVTDVEPALAPSILQYEGQILEAATEPFGVVHSDLHNQHLLESGNSLSGVLDFGDAFIGSTAWDFALVRWYYGKKNAERLAAAYGQDSNMDEQAALLAIAVGCYKLAKSPDDTAVRTRLRTVLNAG